MSLKWFDRIFMVLIFAYVLAIPAVCIHLKIRLDKVYEGQDQVQVEHERNMAVSVSLRSQKAWEDASKHFLYTYEDLQSSYIISQAELKQSRLEMYAFMRALDNYYPGVRGSVLQKMGTTPGDFELELELPVQPTFPNQKDKDEPVPPFASIVSTE